MKLDSCLLHEERKFWWHLAFCGSLPPGLGFNDSGGWSAIEMVVAEKLISVKLRRVISFLGYYLNNSVFNKHFLNKLKSIFPNNRKIVRYNFAFH